MKHGPSRRAEIELFKPPPAAPAAQVVRAEVLSPVVIEIRPESPISGTWRVVAVECDSPRHRGLWLRKGGRLYGGTQRQAHQDAIRVAAENGFVYRPPAGWQIGPGA